MDTIFAPASGRVKAAVAVIRLSGPLAGATLQSLTPGVALPPARQMALRRLRDAAGEVIDDGLVVWFAAGASFTGEESAEVHVHGGTAVVAALLDALSAKPGLRFAEAGEFARRAFDAGRLDLAQVEGLADLIDAETEAQRRQAVRVSQGAIGQLAQSWRSDLVRALALVEACIDFSDEDLPDGLLMEVQGLVAGLRRGMEREVAGSKVAERVRDGFEVAIVGRPNVGKSTLLNALAGREAALTSETAGTTRDVIEVRTVLNGLPVTFLDTAGIRDADEAVEIQGVARGLERAGQADLRVFLLGHPGDKPVMQPSGGDILVQGKSDVHPGDGLGVSGVTGDGIEALTRIIAAELSGRVAQAGTVVAARQRRAICDAVDALDSASKGLECGGEALELVAQDLRQAVASLERLVGRLDVDDVLDVIFSGFCIGK